VIGDDMENIGVEAIHGYAVKKHRFMCCSLERYFIYAMLAGVFCGLGIILAYSAAGNLDAFEATRGLAKIVFGLSFALAFTLIVFAGSELFTGNVLVMTIGTLDKAISLKDALKVLCVVYIGNWLGATLTALLIAATGLLDNQAVGGYIVANTLVKMNLPVGQAIARGILCNMLVCLATWATSKMKSEAARMMILLWSVYGFCTAGFEHSIANMALFVMARFSSWSAPEVSAAGYLHNMLPVTLGNIIGGMLIAVTYYYMGNYKEEAKN
jgi:nitrite transporter NirC